MQDLHPLLDSLKLAQAEETEQKRIVSKSGDDVSGE